MCLCVSVWIRVDLFVCGSVCVCASVFLCVRFGVRAGACVHVRRCEQV